MHIQFSSWQGYYRICAAFFRFTAPDNIPNTLPEAKTRATCGFHPIWILRQAHQEDFDPPH